MEFSHYAFAFFVFVLVCAAILLSAAAHKSSRRERLELDEREKKLFCLYQNMEDLAAGLEDYVREAQSKNDEDAKQLRELAQDMADVLGEAQNQTDSVKQCYEKLRTQGVITEPPLPDIEGVGEEDRESVRATWVVRLDAEGFSPEQIAKKLGVSRGEVALILGMRRNRA